MKRSIIPIFIPHLGCPHLCNFCNQKKISGILKAPDKKEILSLVEEYLAADVSKVYEIAFFGGSFTSLEVEMQKYYLEIAALLKKEKKIDKIRFSTRPDSINEKTLNLARYYKVDIIELGVQSLDDKVLELAERGHNSLDVINAAKLIKNYKFSLGIQLMPGLMGDTRDSIYKTVAGIIDIKPDFVRIYPTVVVKDTKLEELYHNGTFTPVSLEKMVEYVADAYLAFVEKGIKVIRMGLQASENLTSEKDLVGGPYHPAFGELVFSEIYKKEIIFFIENNNVKDKEKVIIFLNKKDTSKVAGQHNKNKEFFKEKYGLEMIFIYSDICKQGQIEIEV